MNAAAARSFLVAIMTAAIVPASAWGQQSGVTAEIRAKREAFNQAIGARDTAALALIWLEDVHVVGSTGGRISGRDAYRERFAAYFRDRREYTYRRETTTIRVHEAWGVAAEQGQWRARWVDADGPVEVGGDFLIHWRRTDTGWFVHAEMFSLAHCAGGRYCQERP